MNKINRTDSEGDRDLRAIANPLPTISGLKLPKIEVTPKKLDSTLRWVSGWQNGHVIGHNTASIAKNYERSLYSMASRKQHDNRFKAQVAIEAIKNQRTMAQIASDYEVHPIRRYSVRDF